MIKKPMLSATLESIDKLKFPVLASPKLDGIRCLKIDGKALTRKFKPIPNVFIRTWLETHLPDGIDGEVMIRNATFNQIQSGVMSEDGKPDFEFHAFDLVISNIETPYSQRISNLPKLPKLDRLVIVENKLISSLEELMNFETECLSNGYEGVMVRSPNGPYKNGRATEREGYLSKLKRFTDSEAVIIGYKERMRNENEATLDELGHTKRSSHKENLIPDNTLGAFSVKDLTTNVIFDVATGMDDALRKTIWNKRESYIGKFIKYKHQEAGQKDKPRFPVFLGFRDERDI